MSATSTPIRLIRTLYDYSAWANARLLETAAPLTADELDASGDGAYGSPRETLVHTMSAQRVST